MAGMAHVFGEDGVAGGGNESTLDLAAPQLMTQNDRALAVEANEVERVFTDFDADCRNGFKPIDLAWHGMLLTR